MLSEPGKLYRDSWPYVRAFRNKAIENCDEQIDEHVDGGMESEADTWRDYKTVLEEFDYLLKYCRKLEKQLGLK